MFSVRTVRKPRSIPGLVALSVVALAVSGCGGGGDDGQAVVLPEPGTSPSLGAGPVASESTGPGEAVASPGAPSTETGSVP